MSLLDLATRQQASDIGGLESLSEFEAKRLIDERTRKEQERNAPVQLAMTMAGQAAESQSDTQKQEQQKAELKQDIDSSPHTETGDSLTSAKSDSPSNNSLGGLFGWLGKKISGGFFGSGSSAGGGGVGGGSMGGK